MTDKSIQPGIWDRASKVDPTLRVSKRDVRALARRQVRPASFSRAALFTAMAAGHPVLFNDVPVPVSDEATLGTRDAVLTGLADSFGAREKFCVRCGPSRTPKQLTVHQLLRRWADDQAKVSVTDLHIRGSGIMRKIDCSSLSGFNLLAGAPDPVGTEEILTMVVSSAGTLSDSHTDDPDGSNHCFAGEKLWLVWDTFEGLARGLEDVERCEVFNQAAFSIAKFLDVPGSRWFTVKAGQTLFLPGHLTHKVITLERYMGVGSFFVMLPSYLRTLLRWTAHTPLWALNAAPEKRLELVDKITRRVIRKVGQLSDGPKAEQARWGLPHMQAAAKPLLRLPPHRLANDLRGNPQSLALINAIRATLA